MITATSNASNESNQLPPATATARSSGHSHLRSGFAEFVGLALTRADRFPNLNSGEKPDLWDLREAAERRELLEELHDRFQSGLSEPGSEFELIGTVWMYIANRCDSPFLNAAEKLWLEFEDAKPPR